jgi:hypothetical protein
VVVQRPQPDTETAGSWRRCSALSGDSNEVAPSGRSELSHPPTIEGNTETDRTDSDCDTGNNPESANDSARKEKREDTVDDH